MPVSQPLLTESSDKTRQRITRREPHPASTRSFQGGTDPFLQLQRTLGNHRVAQLIKAKRLTPEGRIIGGRIPGLQPKLTVGAADDQYEQEADRVARQVVMMPEPVATDSLQQVRQVEGEAGSAQPQTLQSKPSPLAASITPFVQRQMGNEEKIEEEKDQEEDKDELLQEKFFNKSAVTPLQRQPVIQEKQLDLIRAKRLIRKTASQEENHELQTRPLALPVASFVQRQTESDEDAENNETIIQAKLINETYGHQLQRQSAIEEEAEPIQAKPPISLSNSFEAGEDVESRLSRSKGSGSPLPDSVRTYMEPRFGMDFSHVRVHTGSDSLQMNRDVGAQAFTHGSDIYYGAGSSPQNMELTAHELTHVVQQGAVGGSSTTQTKIRRWPDWVSSAAGWVSDTASSAVDTVVEGAEYVGGQVADGARWVGNKVSAGAEWVGDQISAAAQWVIDQIRSAINSGTNYLTEQWESIKQFGSSCFDTIKNGFGNLVHFVTNPLSSLMSALSAMNADLLGGVWSLLKTGANALWAGINSVINGVLQIGEGIWSTVSGFVNGIFNTVAGLFDNSAFDLLPDFIKQEARSILNGLRSLWNQVSTFWTDLWQRLTSSVQEILAGVRSFVDNVIGFSIDSVINMVRDLKEVYDYVMKFFADPRATIQPFLDQIAAKLNTEAPPRANALGNQMAQENNQGGATPTTANGNIQRQESDSEERDTASLDEVGKGILYYIAQFWAELDIKQMLWQTVVNSFWPPATIEAICKEFSDLWNDHWATTVDSLYAPRNFFDDPLGCLHDIWSNFLILLDFPLSLWRTLNHIAGLLIGYVTILVVLVEAILGGIAAAEVGVVPGLLAGAGAGLATMVPIAEGLIASYLLAESSTVIIILVRLFTAQQTCEKRQVDISTSVASFIAMAVALVLQVLMALLAELVNLIAGVLKGAPKPAPQPQPQPQPVAPPAQPGLPPPTPSPIPASPQPQPVPVQPTVPAQPAAPGGGEVIPFRPRPAAPAEPGRIAAKFEDGVSQARFPEPGNNKSSAELADNSDTMQEANPENGSIALSGMQDAENGIIQTARKDKTDPDACKEENPTITHETKFSAPDGSGKTRVNIGVGEEVTFTGSAVGEWTATLGSPKKLASGDSFTWTAPSRAANVTVTLKVGSKTATATMKVIEPVSITAKKNGEIAFPPGTAGAGMTLTFNYHPKQVSFGNVEAKEVSGPATNITGYFKKHYSRAELRHDSGDTFFPIKENNEDSVEDTASSEDHFRPYEDGTFDWVIPNKFKVKTESGDGKKFTTVTQAFSIDSTGKETITKAGEKVERSP